MRAAERRGRSKFLPNIFLLGELIVAILLVYIASMFPQREVHIVTILLVILYAVKSTIPRYFRVVERSHADII